MSNTNHYKVLGVEKDATSDQIKKAYRKLAMKWHPDRNPEHKEEAEKKFKEIGEAYSVLSDDQKRKKYDQFGSEGVNNQFQGSNTHFTYHNAEDVFKNFFGDDNPLLSSMFGGSFGHGMHGNAMPGNFGPFSTAFTTSNGNGTGHMQQKKGKTVEHALYLSLEELYNGTTKTMKVTRKRLNSDQSTRQEQKMLKIDVKPGWKPQTKITFPKEGDEFIGVIPGDIMFIVGQKLHDRFDRRNNDLVYKQRISLKDALLANYNFSVNTLDDRALNIHVNHIIHPGYVHKVHREGMPISKTQGRQRGDLLIEFDIVFPAHLSNEQRNMIRRYL